MNLITTIKQCDNQMRIDEQLFCIEKHVNHMLIDKVIVLLQGDSNWLANHFKNSKINTQQITVIKIQTRPTFQMLFEYCNKHPGVWIIVNSDMYFPGWNLHEFKKIEKLDLDKHMIVLTRYNIYENYNEQQKKHFGGIMIEHDGVEYITQWGAGDQKSAEGSSIDTWIIKTPLDISACNLDIEIGRPECDRMMNHQMSTISKPINPCLSIVSIHNHTNWNPKSRDWYQKFDFQGTQLDRHEYNDMMISRGFQRKNIKFTTIDDHIK